ncbi:hypothetical protein [Paenibacillus graminis]|uniref:hypothetical protein n=1 Tax=Paenibacillus graminis TaxID=189425 RepID=UPI002DBE9A09|nr:hypothetical protein [Paenibacillus graminis]MEC0167371.1 hypothetical protein [Paenibacillus graminis]
MIPSILLGLALLLCSVPLLRLTVPGFERQKRAASVAEWIAQGETGAADPGVVRWVAGRLPGVVTNSKWKLQYNRLGYRSSFELYMAGLLLQSLLPALLLLMLAMISGQWLLFGIGLIVSPLIFVLLIRRIHSAYQKRQIQLIADLPFLIGQMMTALEVGKPLTRIFQEVSVQCGPILQTMLKRLVANMSIYSQRDALQLFAQEVDLPVMYDFVSVVNVVAEKGFHEAEDDLHMVKNGLRQLSKLALREKTRGNPGKMNWFYIAVVLHVLVFFGFMVVKIFGAINAL